MLRPLVISLAKRGITPNQVTVAAFVISLLCGLLVAILPQWRQIYFLVPVTLLLRMAMNAIDGMVAREHNMVTPLGGFLNEAGDVLADAALYLPLALAPGINSTLVVISVVLSGTTELVGVVARGMGGTRRYDGPMGKSDRAFVFGVLFLFKGLGMLPSWTADLVIVAIIGLLILTIRNRIRSCLKEIA